MLRWFLAALAAGAILTANGFPPALAQETVQVRIDSIDTTAHPRVRATMTVLDAGGRPIADLPATAFSAEVDGQEVPVTNVVTALDASVPAAVVLTFDGSGSMQGAAINQAREAGKALVSQLGPNDQVAVVRFAETVQLIQGFTNDRGALTGAIDSIQASGDTALYDGVVAAVDTAQGGAQRRAVVLLSDGLDFGGVSQNDRAASLSRAQSAGVPFFVVGLGDSIDQPYLQELANVTRGQLFLAPSPASLQGLYETIGAALRSQYLVDLDTSEIDPSTPRTLQVRVSDGARTGVAQTSLDLTAFATSPTAGPTVPPSASPPIATVPPTPIIEEPAGGGSLLLVALGLAGAAVAAIGGTAAGAFWLSRRRRTATAEPEVIREPAGPDQSQPAVTMNDPVFVGSGPLGLPSEADAWLEVLAPEPIGRFPLGDDPITVGFTGDCTICLPNGGGQEGARVRVWRREGRYMLHNLSRLGRVTIAGKPATWAVLEDGDEILVGSYRVLFRDSSAPKEEPAEDEE
jgi:VWFA-related protein